jgi:hypothetical protein
VKYFRKSTFTSTQLKAQWIQNNVQSGIKAIGNTRFLTFYYAGKSVLENLSSIHDLIKNKTLTLTPVSTTHPNTRYIQLNMRIQKVSIYWMIDRLEVHIFENTLTQLVAVLQPLARALKCLESTQTTVSDVYVFNLAILASYLDMFMDNNKVDGLHLPDNIIEETQGIINTRWAQLTEGKHK